MSMYQKSMKTWPGNQLPILQNQEFCLHEDRIKWFYYDRNVLLLDSIWKKVYIIPNTSGILHLISYILWQELDTDCILWSLGLFIYWEYPILLIWHFLLFFLQWADPDHWGRDSRPNPSPHRRPPLSQVCSQRVCLLPISQHQSRGLYLYMGLYMFV